MFLKLLFKTMAGKAARCACEEFEGQEILEPNMNQTGHCFVRALKISEPIGRTAGTFCCSALLKHM